MVQDTYYVDKSTGTFADALEAFGVAFVLQAVMQHGAGGQAGVRLVDAGPVYAIELMARLQAEWIDTCPFFTAAPFLRTIKNAKKLPAGLPDLSDIAVSYEAQKQRREEYWELVKRLSKEANLARIRRASHPELEALRGKEPHEFWDIFRALNPGSVDTYNNAVSQWWAAQPAFPELLRVLLQMLSSTPNDLAGASTTWGKVCKAHGLEKPKEVTAAQLFNPAQGKGQNRPKPDGAKMENVGNFWLVEYLKVVGMYQAGLTFIVLNPRDPRNAKDRKTYVVMPRDIRLDAHADIMQRFRQAMSRSQTAVKLDVLASLRYTRAFLGYAEESRERGELEILLNLRPDKVIAGLQMAFYKNLGQSAATMNIAFLGLPTWVRLGKREEVQAFQDVLTEHETVIRALDETRSEAYELLQVYRDFLSGNRLDPFFDFTTGYAAYWMSQKVRNQWCPSFTMKRLEVLLMNSDEGKRLSEIVESPGFRNIAYAIRHSTVVPQSQKANKQTPIYDIRYGLGQRLARKANYKEDFIAELGEFLHEYSAENGQQLERRGRHFRKVVRESDLVEIVRLVDKFGSAVVCNLLIAFGYAYADRPGAQAGIEAPEAVAALPEGEAEIDFPEE